LLGTIAGYMDVMRVYTSVESRTKVKKATETVLRKEGFESKVSMS
jgi:hypothetical protein